MKKYKLLKDLPFVKAGSILTEQEGHNDRPCLCKDEDDMGIIVNSGKYEKMKEAGIFYEWFEEIEESRVWEPRRGDKYWYIDECGSVDIYVYDGDDTDQMILELGNCFRTQKDAEQAVEKLKALRRLREKGFDFYDFFCQSIDDHHSIEITAHIHKRFDDEIEKDLRLLFRGEDK